MFSFVYLTVGRYVLTSTHDLWYTQQFRNGSGKEMTIKEPKVKNKDKDPRGALFKAAVDLFSEKGYEATSVREIVERAGVTKPVLYYYFGSKSGLLDSILKYALSMHQETLQRALAYEGHVFDRLAYLYSQLRTEAKKHRNLGKMISSTIFSPVPVIPQEQIRQFMTNTGSAIRQIYMDGVAKSEILSVEPGTVTFLLMGMLDYALIFDFLDNDVLPAGDPVEMWKLVYNGLLPKGI